MSYLQLRKFFFLRLDHLTQHSQGCGLLDPASEGYTAFLTPSEVLTRFLPLCSAKTWLWARHTSCKRLMWLGRQQRQQCSLEACQCRAEKPRAVRKDRTCVCLKQQERRGSSPLPSGGKAGGLHLGQVPGGPYIRVAVRTSGDLAVFKRFSPDLGFHCLEYKEIVRLFLWGSYRPQRTVEETPGSVSRRLCPRVTLM